MSDEEEDRRRRQAPRGRPARGSARGGRTDRSGGAGGRGRNGRPPARRNDRNDRDDREERDSRRGGRGQGRSGAPRRGRDDRERSGRPPRRDRDGDRRRDGRDRDRDRDGGRGRPGRAGGARRNDRDRPRGERERRGRAPRDNDGRRTTSTRAGTRRGPGAPSLPIRGRIVEYPSPRYRGADENAEQPPRKSSLRAVGRRGAPQPKPKPAATGKGKGTRKRAPAKPPTGGARRRAPRRSEAGDELSRLAGRNATRAQGALDRAATAYNEGRERDAARDLRALRDAYPDAAGVRELLGLADYRLGHFNAAAKELEVFVELTGSVEQHPVLMDCYRAGRRYREVENLWRELAETSPSAELVTEGRIVAAGALADQGRVSDAIALLERKASDTKRPREHHLRLWYALGDLYERAGELPRARELFERIRHREPDFVDVAERLAALH